MSGFQNLRPVLEEQNPSVSKALPGACTSDKICAVCCAAAEPREDLTVKSEQTEASQGGKAWGKTPSGGSEDMWLQGYSDSKMNLLIEEWENTLNSQELRNLQKK